MSASRSRQKRKLEPISIEELAGTTGMSGFCSFLTRDSSISVPILDHLETSAPETGAGLSTAVEADALESSALQTSGGERRAGERGASQGGAPDGAAFGSDAPKIAALDFEYGFKGSRDGPQTSAPESPAPKKDAPVDGGVETSAPEVGAPELGDFRYRRRPRIREAVSLQDGHSLAEQAVYDAMCREGKPYRGDARILTIGLRTLAEISRMAYSNCKANVRSLVAKLALDELPGFSYTDGRTYIIHGEVEILRRRKEAGLTHVLRTRGVAFVDPRSGAPISGAPDSM